MNLKDISDRELLENTKTLVLKERQTTLEVLHHLREVERRSLFATLAYSSLFEYAVSELKYTAAAAQRRISSMRLLKELPELEKKIETGALSLSTLSQAQVFFRQEKSPLSEKKEILQLLENKSARAVEKELITRASEPLKLSPEKLRPVSDTYTELKVLLKENALKNIEQLRGLLAHKNPHASLSEILDFALAYTAKGLTPKEPKAPSAQNPENRKRPPTVAFPTSEVTRIPSRYIPVEIKRAVWKRDKGECTYTDGLNGRKCCSNHGLEYDHINPHALGGETSVQNLRLRCRSHNQLAAAQSYGQQKIAQFVPRMR